ncbi:hypothetical protein ACWEIJ_41835 [Lentzea sp. NPDC004789]
MSVEWTVEDGGELSVGAFFDAFAETVHALTGARPSWGVVRGDLAGRQVELTSDDDVLQVRAITTHDVYLDFTVEVDGRAAVFNLTLAWSLGEDEEERHDLTYGGTTALSGEASFVVAFAAACALSLCIGGELSGPGLTHNHDRESVARVVRELTQSSPDVAANLQQVRARLRQVHE